MVDRDGWLVGLFYGLSTFFGSFNAELNFVGVTVILVDMEHSNFVELFLPSSGRVNTAIWMHYLDANKTAREEARQQLHKNVASNIEQVLAATPHKTPTIRPPASHHENYPS